MFEYILLEMLIVIMASVMYIMFPIKCNVYCNFKLLDACL